MSLTSFSEMIKGKKRAVALFNSAQNDLSSKKPPNDNPDISGILSGNMSLQHGKVYSDSFSLVVSLPTDSQDSRRLDEFLESLEANNKFPAKASLEQCWGRVESVADAVDVMSQDSRFQHYMLLQEPSEKKLNFVLNKKMVETLMSRGHLPSDTNLQTALDITTKSAGMVRA